VATRRWTGGSNNGSWSDAGNWSGAAVPVTADDVIIDVTNQSITGGLNQTGVALASLTVLSGVNIGGNGSALVIGVTGTARFAGTGSIYISADTGVQTIAKAVVQGKGAPTVYFTGGTVTTLEVAEGASAYVQSGCVVTTVNCAGGLTLESNGTGVTTLEQDGGSVISYRNIATLNEAGDSGTTCRLVTSAAITTAATIRGSARYVHNSSGTITLITVHPSAVATSNGGTHNFTVTNAYRWYGATLFDSDTEPASVTYSNPVAKVLYA
jgi:hypothetical protein